MAKEIPPERYLQKKCDRCQHISGVGERRYYFSILCGSGYTGPTTAPREEMSGQKRFTLCKDCFEAIFGDYPELSSMDCLGFDY